MSQPEGLTKSTAKAFRKRYKALWLEAGGSPPGADDRAFMSTIYKALHPKHRGPVTQAQLDTVDSCLVPRFVDIASVYTTQYLRRIVRVACMRALETQGAIKK